MSETAERWCCGIFGVILLALFPIAYFVLPHLRDEYISVCVFMTLTRLPCVFCGLTHALAHATHGHWDQALEFHALWWVSPPVMVGLSLFGFFDAFRGTHFLRALVRLFHRYGFPVVSALVVLSLLRATYTALSA